MKGSEIEVGTRIWEDSGIGDPYSAGRVMALSDSVERSDVVYVLLKDDDGAFTIYSVEKNFNCSPRLTRKVPRENFEYLVRTALSGVELPEERDPLPKKVKSAPKAAKETTVVVSDPAPQPCEPVIASTEETECLDDSVQSPLIVIHNGDEIEFEEFHMGFDVTMGGV